MGSSGSKAINFVKALEDKEIQALKNVFFNIVAKDEGGNNKIPSIMSYKTLKLLFSDYDNFCEKLFNWMLYLKNYGVKEDISRKLLSKEGIGINTFLLAIEALAQCHTSKIYYTDYKLLDTGKLLLYILKSDLKSPDDYFNNNPIQDLQDITFEEAEKLFNLLYNFLNKTDDIDHRPFPYTKSIFHYDNKEVEDVKEWKMRYDSFKFQLKRVIPFTVKFGVKYIEAHTMYNIKYNVSESGEKLWSSESLAAKTSQIPILSEDLKAQINILNDEIWSTLFLALPKLEICKDVDMIYNSSTDGLSFNRLSYALIGYKAPHIILIRHQGYPEDVKEGSHEEEAKEWVLGAYIDCETKDNAKYGGNLNGCIFTYSPVFKVFRTINNKGGTNYTYMNTVKIENSEIAYGLGLGGTVKEPRLWLDGDDITEKSYVTPEDTTYEIGNILTRHKLQNLSIHKIEIFGLGGQEAIEEREEYRKMMGKLRDKKKQVDKKAFLESDFDKEFLLGNTFSHQKQKEDRNNG